MGNLKTSQLPNKPVPQNSDNFRYGNDYRITWAQIEAALGLTSIATLSIASNTAQYLTLFSVTAQVKTTLDVYFKRGTTRYRMEQLQVMSDGVDIVIMSSGFKTIPINDTEDCGVTLSVSVISGFAVLEVATDNSDAETTVMTYKSTFNG